MENTKGLREKRSNISTNPNVYGVCKMCDVRHSLRIFSKAAKEWEKFFVLRQATCWFI